MNKIRKGEVKIYKGKEYIAIPEIEEESCTGCCFYDKGICLINHADDPNCLHSGMIWEQKENSMSDIKEKAIKLAIDAMKPIPIHSSPCYSVRPYFVGFGRQNSTTILHGILINAYICIHS